LSPHSFSGHLDLWIIGSWVTCDGIALEVNGFALACNAFEFLTDLCRPFPRIDLGHGEGTMSEQATDDLKRHIIVDEPHPKRVPKLVGGKAVQFSCAIFDVVFHRPLIEQGGEGFLFEWEAR
jgi:hypothetical protein